MRGKEGLFQLIKAMSRSEKRYFTLDAQKSGKKGNRYLDMFQYINAMDDYDEIKLKKKFKGTKNLSSDKAYLYDAILRSMRDYRSSKSRSAQIKEKLLDFRYLYELGLYELCEDRLKEARELAVELGDNLVLLEINKEERLLSNVTKNKNYETDIKDLTEDKDKNLKAVYEEFKYLDIHDFLIVEVLKNFEYKSETKKCELRAEIAPATFDLNNTPNFRRAQLRFFQCGALYNQLLGNFEQVFDFYTKVVKWWDDNPKYKEEEFYRHILDMSNLLHACFIKEQFNQIPTLIGKLEKEKPVSFIHQSILFQKIYNYKLMYYINTGTISGTSDIVEKINKGLNTYQLNAGSKMALIFNVAVFLFIQEDYLACINWTKNVFKQFKTSLRKDIKIGIQLLYLAATFESGELENIENTIRSTYRYLHEKANSNKENFEFRIIYFIRQLSTVPQADKKEILQNFKIYLTDVQKNPNERVSLGLDALILCWVESKLQKTTMSKVIQTSNTQQVA